MDSTLARVNDNLGKSLFATKEYEEARVFFERALFIRKQIYDEISLVDIVRMYYNIGMTYFDSGQEFTSISYFDSAATNPPSDFGIISILGNLRIGQSYHRIGELNRAIIHFNKANQLYDQLGGPVRFKIEIVDSYASCYRDIKAFKQGIQMIDQTLLDLEEQNECRQDIADLYLELGNLWQDSINSQGNLESLAENTINIYQEALSCYTELKNPEDKVINDRIALTSGNLGEFYRRLSKTDKAIQLLSKQIDSDIFSTFSHRRKVQLLLNRGEANLDAKAHKKANQDLSKAMGIILPEVLNSLEIKTKLTSDYLLRDYQILILSNMAKNQIAISEDDPQSLTSAIPIYDSLTSFIHRYRADLISEEAKMGLSSNIQKSLENAFGTAISLYKLTKEKEYLEQAFYFSEERKAFTLLEATRLNQFHDLLDEDDREKEQTLEKEQARLRTALQVNEGNPDMKVLLQDSIAENFKEIGTFNEALKKDYPKYHQLKTKRADLTIEQIQHELLADDQAMLEYYYTPEALYLFLISKEDFQLKEVSLENTPFQESLRTFKSIMSTGAERKQEGEDGMVGELGYQLYQLLIKPVAPILPKRVMIIPDKELNTFPFEALVKKEGFTTPGEIADEEQFLIFEHSLAYCFSANLWWQMHQIQPRNTNKLALINCEFNPDLHKNKQEQISLGTLSSSKRFLKPLGRAQVNEMEGIEEKAARAKCVDEASKEDFLSLCEKYGRIHLATHGIVHKSQQQLNYISFSQSADTLDADQLLFLKDLLPYNWEMDFVFLSACQTASGEFIEGEGNMSLARGLAYAGVKSFVTTLWDVPTQPKADLVPRFYDYLLNDDEAKDIALQKAKMEVVYKYPHPANWAGFSLSGSF
ncbi:MAG: CHAT domain-containing tetratricopeptide repeat protein [Bacteroidota bacterium]